MFKFGIIPYYLIPYINAATHLSWLTIGLKDS